MKFRDLPIFFKSKNGQILIYKIKIINLCGLFDTKAIIVKEQ